MVRLALPHVTPPARTGQPQGRLREPPSSLVPRQVYGGSASALVPRALGVGCRSCGHRGEAVGSAQSLTSFPRAPRAGLGFPLLPAQLPGWPGERRAGGTGRLAPAGGCGLSSQWAPCHSSPCVPLAHRVRPSLEKGCVAAGREETPLDVHPRLARDEGGPSTASHSRELDPRSTQSGGQHLGSRASDTALESS